MTTDHDRIKAMVDALEELALAYTRARILLERAGLIQGESQLAKNAHQLVDAYRAQAEEPKHRMLEEGAEWPKYFLHCGGFADDVVFLRFDSEDRGVCVGRDSRETTCYRTFEECQWSAKSGSYRQISELEALKLRKGAPSRRPITPDAR